MSYIETTPMQHSTILRVYSDNESFNLDPDYQRMGDIWSLQKKQLLIDSILNNYDIPKIYFHLLDRDEKKLTGFNCAVIDGRQRLETIWGFIDGKFSLSDDFIYLDEPNFNLKNMTYEQIAEKYPKIKIKFDSYVLPIINVVTDDLDLIEEMFSRLNEAVPLNSAEKRNAIGGELVRAIRELAIHPFFINNVAFSNKRFQHYENLARILIIESHLIFNDKLVDTKKIFLDQLATNYKNKKNEVNQLEIIVKGVLDKMHQIFNDKDALLRSQGNIVIYYLLIKSDTNAPSKKLRSGIEDFLDKVKLNKEFANNADEDQYNQIDYELVQYSRLLVQGTNDISNIRSRLKTISKFLSIEPIELSN